MNEKCAKIVCKTMLLPFFDYCDIVYMFSGQNELKKINRHHIRGMKICLNNGFYLEEDLYVNCNLSKLSVRRQVHLRNFMYEIKNIEENIHGKMMYKWIQDYMMVQSLK